MHKCGTYLKLDLDYSNLAVEFSIGDVKINSFLHKINIHKENFNILLRERMVSCQKYGSFLLQAKFFEKQ